MHRIVVYLLVIAALPLRWGVNVLDASDHSLELLRIAGAILLWPLFFAVAWREPKRLNTHLALLILIVAAQYLIHCASPAMGLRADYFANNTLSPPIETEWRFSRLEGSTRIDSHINFSGTGFSLGEDEFPLYFLNDTSRSHHIANSGALFNERFLFSARWTGFISVPDSVAKLQLRGNAGVMSMSINGMPIASDAAQIIVAPVTPGPHAIEIRYRRTSDESPSLQLGWFDDLRYAVVPPRYLAPLSADFSSKILPYASTLLTLIFAAYLIPLMRTQFAEVSVRKIDWHSMILWLLFVYAAITALNDVMGGSENFATFIFHPGDDWSVYETQARNILGGDWLDNKSSNSQVFFRNVFYRYFLAGMHLVFGENPLAVVWGQQLILNLFVIGFYLSVRRLYGATAAVIALLLTIMLRQLLGFADVLLDTTFNIVFAYVAVVGLVAYKCTTSRSMILLSATALGAAISLRGNFLPFVAVALLWLCYVNWTKQVSWHKHLVPYTMIVFLPLLLIGVRNYVLADEFKMMPSSGGYNFWLAHNFNEFSDFAWAKPDKPDDAVIFAETLRMIAENPTGLARRTQLKLMYLLGYDSYDNFSPVNRILIPHIVFIFSLLYLWFSRFRRDELLLYTGWIFTNWFTLVLIFPWGYGWRLSASTFPFVYLVIAIGLAHLCRRVDWTKWGAKRVKPI